MAFLSGTKVIDLSRFVAGPYCSMLLGDYGADVMKVEQPLTGDGSRKWAKESVGPDNPYYLAHNRNKRSITVDIRHPQGRQLIRDLMLSSDVVLHNFKTGTLEPLGLGHEEMRRERPSLVYCEISGYGLGGPYRDRPALDVVVQAQGGLMSMLGEAGGAPVKVPFPIADLVTALYATVAIIAALHDRTRTGVGAWLSTSLIEGMVASMTNPVSDYLVSGIMMRPMGNAHPHIAPYEVHAASDGLFVVAVATEPHWRRFCVAIGRADLAEDVRFASNPLRLKHRKELAAELDAIFAAATVSTWLDRLNAHRLPCGPINDLASVFADPQVKALELVTEIAHPTRGSVSLVRSPISVNGQAIPVHRAPPTLGQHTDEILAEFLGLGVKEIARLHETGAI